MPVLSNPRHEKFCQELAKGKSASEAYKLAGYETQGNAAEASASRLLRNAKVQTRLAELQERAARKAQITQESLLNEAEEARKLAMSLGQPSAAVAAIKEKGVLSGLRVEKSERTNKNDPRVLTDEELLAIASALEGDSGEGDFDEEGDPPLVH